MPRARPSSLVRGTLAAGRDWPSPKRCCDVPRSFRSHRAPVTPPHQLELAARSPSGTVSQLVVAAFLDACDERNLSPDRTGASREEECGPSMRRPMAARLHRVRGEATPTRRRGGWRE